MLAVESFWKEFSIYYTVDGFKSKNNQITI